MARMTQKRFFELLGAAKGKATIENGTEIRIGEQCPITLVHALLTRRIKELNLEEYDAGDYEVAAEQLGLDAEFAQNVTSAADYDESAPLRRKLFKTLDIKWKE